MGYRIRVAPEVEAWLEGPGTPKCSCVAASATSATGGAPANVEGCLTISG